MNWYDEGNLRTQTCGRSETAPRPSRACLGLHACPPTHATSCWDRGLPYVRGRPSVWEAASRWTFTPCDARSVLADCLRVQAIHSLVASMRLAHLVTQPAATQSSVSAVMQAQPDVSSTSHLHMDTLHCCDVFIICSKCREGNWSTHREGQTNELSSATPAAQQQSVRSWFEARAAAPHEAQILLGTR
jgi:hypothetical protein